MSALGQKQTLRNAIAMSALPPKADIPCGEQYVRFVPIADIRPLIRSPRRHERAATAARVRPSAFAVLRLITSSSLVGAYTGRSAGFSPFLLFFLNPK